MNDSWVAESLARAGVFVVVTAVALGIAKLLRRLSWRSTVSRLPGPAERKDLLAVVRELRGNGASLDRCIEALVHRGVKKGVARSLVLDVEREQPADVKHPREVRWREWRFSVPGNWRTAPLWPGAPEAAGVSVDGVGGCMFMLIALGPGTDLATFAAPQEKQIRLPERHSLSAWGGLRGTGTLLRGEHAQLRVPVELTLFRPDLASDAVAVLEWKVLEESALVDPGFALIRASFTRAT